MPEPKTILGISPGTMYTGIAIFRQDDLIEYQVKTFYGKITKKKLQRVITAVQKIIDFYAVESIAMKIPEGKCTSKKVWQLIADIENISGEKGLPLFSYTLSELKQKCLINTHTSRKNLAENLMKKYPELSFVEQSYGLNKYTYYGKMFEAVAAGVQHITKL